MTTLKRLHPSHVISISIGIVLLTTNCSRSSDKTLVESAPAYQPSSTTAQIKIPNLRAPKLPEVQDAVRRVFKDSAILDTSVSPNFLVGDFNGDATQDLAVVVRPAPGKFTEMNEEYPAWLLRDALLTDRNQRPNLTVDENETLLAIIHGFGNEDWRDPQATQTYLLKNAVAAKMSVSTAAEFLQSHSGRKTPRPQGDIIGGKLRDSDGYLYYTNANYSWYDPKTYKPVNEQLGMVHRRR